MKITLDKAIDCERDNMHSDIVAAKDYQRDLKENLKKKNYRETEVEKYKRLYMEFDSIGDYENAEKNIQNYVFKCDNEEAWVEYSKLALKYG